MSEAHGAGDQPSPGWSESPIMRWFQFDHLPAGPLQATSAMFAELAWRVERALAPGAEKSTALRNLLIAKDAAVRAAKETQEAQQ